MELIFATSLERLVVLVFESGPLRERFLAESERLSELLYPRQQSFRRIVCHDED